MGEKRSLRRLTDRAYCRGMTELALEPGGGLRGLPIGSSKGNVRTFFGDKHQPFKRTPEGNPMDYWADAGVFAYYDSDERLEALEFASPSNPTLNGLALISVSMGEATQILQSLDPKLRLEPDGATSTQLGIGVWSSTGEVDQPVMSAITFGSGYYD
ncbi:hypothetical protein NKH89_34885 [Mesorhizobium sp. M0923]|uniref:hypothetical protein n=1 Tax=Mesorhizobium sp. M0923 TaxID=2957028 RepID=UPI0033369C62